MELDLSFFFNPILMGFFPLCRWLTGWRQWPWPCSRTGDGATRGWERQWRWFSGLCSDNWLLEEDEVEFAGDGGVALECGVSCLVAVLEIDGREAGASVVARG